MQVPLLATVSIALHAIACGEASSPSDLGRASGAVGGATGAGASSAAEGACPDPTSVVPDVPPFEAPPIGALGSFQLTFHNLCAKTVWPAWGSAGGLDNSVIDTRLWFPMDPGSDRSVTVYGGLRDIGFWGRTGCSFDPGGGGGCRTGDCGGFVCPIVVNAFPTSATVFALQQGFLLGYNIPLRVEGGTCGSHECSADLATCSPDSVVGDGCGTRVACNDVCDGSTECCSRPGSGCEAPAEDDVPEAKDLVITFCP